ncbi:MAG: hypothetical protein IJI75_11605 [Solobacterium sp.]|nr:hypothetical protein [Solobacterium sp.]
MGKRKNGIIKGVLAAVLFVPAMVHGTLRTQASLNVDADCYLTANAETEFQKDLEDYRVGSGDSVTDRIVVDYYRIAGITKDEHYDTFTYDLIDGYSLTGYDISNYDGLSKLESNDWNTIEEQLFGQTLTNDPDVTKNFGEKTDEKEVSTGLYLMVVHNLEKTKAEDYVKENTTTAYTEQYVYTFTPQLVSLPSTNEDTRKEMKTSDGTWIYDLTITLKAERERRLSSLRIEKLLESYEDSSPVTFVFDIVGTIDGEPVYSNVTSLTFSDAGLDTALVEGIPVGAHVTVTEVYSGVSYELTTDAEAETDILVPVEKGKEPTADNTATVRFGNEYNGKIPHGHGIKNIFTFSEKGWAWTEDGGAE